MIKIAQGLLGEEELQEVKEAFAYGYFGHAHKTEQFEKAAAELIGVPDENVLATNTGTSALHLALDAAGIKAGDEVLVPSMTFVATYQAVSALGAVPVSCDVYESSLLLDVEDAKRRLTAKTRAIIPVHYCGNPCEMDEIMTFAAQNRLRVIEDAAHAFGGEYKGRKIGSFGDVACFSFDSIKTITCGEGGLIVSGDTALIRSAKRKRALCMDRQAHTGDWKDRKQAYDVAGQGYRYHMSNINAAIGLAQIKKINRFIERRRQICRQYVGALSSLRGAVELLDIDYEAITPFMFVVKVKQGRRDAFMQFLKERDIESAVKYPPCHLFSYYRRADESLAQTEQAAAEILELPLHCLLTDEDVRSVLVAIKEFFAKGGKCG